MSKPLKVAIEGKQFELGGRPLQVLGDIHFEVAAGSLVSLLGPSGCGKTTLLRLVSGLEEEYRGQIASLHGNFQRLRHQEYPGK